MKKAVLRKLREAEELETLNIQEEIKPVIIDDLFEPEENSSDKEENIEDKTIKGFLHDLFFGKSDK